MPDKKNNHLDYVVFIGVAVGFTVAVAFLPGGFDALTFYLKPPFSTTTAPAWVYLITYPLSFLRWPWGWQALVLLSILSAGMASFIWGNERWWVAIFSVPMIWNVWLGQIELFPMIGVILTGLVLQKKIPALWLGVSWLALATKPQVGVGILILQFYWVWSNKELGKRAFFQAMLSCIVVFVATLFLWPEWIINWIDTMSHFKATWWNGSIWPYGLLAWPVVLYVFRRANQRQALRMFAIASLLSSPYFALYHSVTFLTLTEYPFALVISWLILLIGNDTGYEWMQWAWILPAAVLSYDVIQLVRTRPTLTEINLPDSSNV